MNNRFVFWGRTTLESLEQIDAPERQYQYLRRHGTSVHEEFYFVEEDDIGIDREMPLYWLAL